MSLPASAKSIGSINSIFLSDFTSHAETKISLAPPGGLTMLAGKTAAGKSQVIRALRLLDYNVPNGDEYIRTGRDRSTVAVEMSDSAKVARERSRGSINRYRIVKPGQDPQVYEGFGLGVPLEVQEITGVRTVSVGESLDLALNLSEQLDGPFLGNKAVSGPARAKILGKLSGTEEIDEAQRALGTDLHRAGQDASRLTDEVEGLDIKIAAYDYLPALAERIAAMDAVLVETRSLQARLATLEALSARLAGIYTQRAQALAVLAGWAGLVAAVSHVEYAADANAKTLTLSNHKATRTSIYAQRDKWQAICARWTGLSDGAVLVAEAGGGHSREIALIGLRDARVSTTQGIARVRTVLFRWANLDAGVAMASKCSVASVSLDQLRALANNKGALRIAMEMAMTARDKWSGLHDANKATEQIPDVLTNLSALTGFGDALTRNRQSRVVAEHDLDKQRKALNDAQSLYADILTSIGKCPLCGSVVDPASIKSHIKEVA